MVDALCILVGWDASVTINDSNCEAEKVKESSMGVWITTSADQCGVNPYRLHKQWSESRRDESRSTDDAM